MSLPFGKWRFREKEVRRMGQMQKRMTGRVTELGRRTREEIQNVGSNWQPRDSRQGADIRIAGLPSIVNYAQNVQTFLSLLQLFHWLLPWLSFWASHCVHSISTTPLFRRSSLSVSLLWKPNHLVTHCFCSQAPHSGTRYHTMFAIPSLPLCSSQP